MALQIRISDHIIERYIQRFNPNLASVADTNKRFKLAENGINSILSDAKYVSDSPEGVLLYSQLFNCNIIMRNRTMVTLWKPDPKVKHREGKHRRDFREGRSN